MARIQILELPTEHHGDDMTTPFVVIIDKLPTDEDQAAAIRHDLNNGDLPELLGARAVLCFDGTIDIPANGTPAYLGETVRDSAGNVPDFTRPLAGRIEIRQRCPHCGDQQMIPRSQIAEHVAQLHPDQHAADA